MSKIQPLLIGSAYNGLNAKTVGNRLGKFMVRWLLIPIGVTLLSACGGGIPELSDPPATAPLNDTGVTQCRSGAEIKTCPQSSTPGQDAEQGRDAQAIAGSLIKTGGGNAGFDFTKLGMNGQPLAIQNQQWKPDGDEAKGTSWRCVRDNHTGLIWEVKSSLETDLHFGGDTFSWYNTEVSTNGGEAGGQDKGFCSHTPCDTQGLITKVNGEKLCGLTNWRLPSPGELLSIVDQSQINPPVDSHYFPNVSFNAHWTQQTHADRPNAAWYVYFTAGDNGAIAKTSIANALLVSAGR